MNKTTETDVQTATSSYVNQTSGAPTGMRSPSGPDWRRKERKGGLEARFWAKVDRSGPVPAHSPDLGNCWVWTAARTELGYGHIWTNGRMELAHRVGFQLAGKIVPAGYELDHLCRNRSCVRAEHLEAVTHFTNMQRSPFVATSGRYTTAALASRSRDGRTTEEQHARRLEQVRRYRASHREAINARAREYQSRHKGVAS